MIHQKPITNVHQRALNIHKETNTPFFCPPNRMRVYWVWWTARVKFTAEFRSYALRNLHHTRVAAWVRCVTEDIARRAGIHGEIDRPHGSANVDSGGGRMAE
jgi:hypothetical protein